MDLTLVEDLIYTQIAEGGYYTALLESGYTKGRNGCSAGAYQ